MNTHKAVSKEGLKWRCTEHPNILGDFICLDGDAKVRVMCFRCLQANPVPLSNLISMSCILDSKEHNIFETYPPLKDQVLSAQLRRIGLEQSLEEIDIYFMKLRKDFEREVKAAQQRAKEILIKQEYSKQKILDGYKRIAEIEKLKELIVSNKAGAEKDLDEFIKDKWNKAELNRKFMYELMSLHGTGQPLSFDEPNRIAQNMIDNLKSINFFEQPIQQQVFNLIKSTIGFSQQMEITNYDNTIYYLKQQSSIDWGQVYLDPILNPSQKYILQIELEMKPGNNYNYFLFGLVKDQGKDDDYAQNQNMCYCDSTNCHGVTKFIKGDPMQFGTKSTGKHSYEVRIHLDQKLLRVASLPDYSSIAELDDSEKIDPKVNYRFFFSMCQQGDMIRINDIRTVYKFDDNM